MKKNNLLILQFLIISLLVISCGSSEEDEYVPPAEAVPAPTPDYTYTPPVYNPPNNGGGSTPIDDDDSVAEPLPGDLPVGTHVIATAKKYDLLYADNNIWNSNYYGTSEGSNLHIEQVYALKGDVLELNVFASIRAGTREGVFKVSCNNRYFVPLTVWVGNKTYTLWPIWGLNKATLKEEGNLSIGTASHHKKEKPCLSIDNFQLKIHAK